MSFNPFTVNEHSTINPELDPDTIFFESISSRDTKYFTVNETKTIISNIDSESFTVLHLNIRSMEKNFDIFQEFFKELKFNVSAICLSETWCESIDAIVKKLVAVPFTLFSSEGLGICLLPHHHISQIFHGQLSHKRWNKSQDLLQNLQI